MTMHGSGGVSRDVKALGACVLVLFAAGLAAGVEPGRACSCALPDPRAALAQADGAFVGKLVSRRHVDQNAVLTYSAERALKGSIGATVEVVTASNGAACGIEAPVGTRSGLILERRGGAWHGHLCWQFDPEELLSAALPLPPPNGRGPVALIVGAQLGDTRLLALDRRGRTLAYGRGGGRVSLVSVCPERHRLAELAHTGTGTTLVIRNTRTLRIVRRQTLSLPGRRYAQRLSCADSAGASVVVFAHGPLGDSPARAAIYRVKRDRVLALWNGAAYDAGITQSAAYLSGGTSGRDLLRVDLDTRRVRRLATLPGATSPVLNDRETLLAGVVTRVGRPSRIVRVDPTARPARVRSTAVPGQDVYAQVFWLENGQLLFVPAYGADDARALDSALRTRSHFRWRAGSAALVGAQLFGIDQTLSLYRAELPSGPTRVVRRLPGRPTVIVSASS